MAQKNLFTRQKGGYHERHRLLQRYGDGIEGNLHQCRFRDEFYEPHPRKGLENSSKPFRFSLMRAQATQNAVTQEGGRGMYNKILVPLDGSARAEDILPHVAD
jgi:hypothetical protein